MKIRAICIQCAKEDIHNISRVHVDVRDDSVYEFICSRGHHCVFTVQEQKFEILFEIGANAIVDGYYREAVSSFASSLERFHDFYIRAALADNKIPQEAIDSSWRIISKQSERQLGAFIFLYTLLNRRSPMILPNDRMAFRNRVIHEGKIPTRDEAIEFGQAVLDVVRPLMLEAKKNFPKGVDAVVVAHLRKAAEGLPPSRGGMTIPTIISLTAGEVSYHDTPLAEHIKRIESSRSRRQ
jgi:hypothetical protein